MTFCAFVVFVERPMEPSYFGARIGKARNPEFLQVFDKRLELLEPQ